MRRPIAHAFTVLVAAAAALIVSAGSAQAQISQQLIIGNSLTIRTLTSDGSDVSSITMARGIISMSAPPTNKPLSSLRKVFWPTSESASRDGEVCASWLDQSDGIVQEGVALHIVDGRTSVRAVTVTKNVIYGVQWVFNVHTWDSTAAQPFTVIGQYDMSRVVTANNQYLPFPWRICARTAGTTLTFKVWVPSRQAEPSWSDPVHAVTTSVPAGYVAPGRTGWYVGHLPAGGSAHYGTAAWIYGIGPQQPRH
jgi:hypothetical protein